MLNAIVDWAVRSRLLVVIGLFAAVIVAVFTIPDLTWMHSRTYPMSRSS